MSIESGKGEIEMVVAATTRARRKRGVRFARDRHASSNKPRAERRGKRSHERSNGEKRKRRMKMNEGERLKIEFSKVLLLFLFLILI